MSVSSPAKDPKATRRDHLSNGQTGRYVLISPCRNEAQFMRQTLDSVIAQSVRPAKWVIVDDGSNDATPQILAEYQKKYDWIDVMTRRDRGARSVGPGVIEAFYAGYDAINPDDYDYLCKLDLDLRLPPRYFEILLERMAATHRIATCSGKAYYVNDGRLVSEGHWRRNVDRCYEILSYASFKEIGGFVREVMWDGIDCHRCRMNGWVACSWDDPDLRFIHLRPMGSSQQKHLCWTDATWLRPIFYGDRIPVHGCKCNLPDAKEALRAWAGWQCCGAG